MMKKDKHFLSFLSSFPLPLSALDPIPSTVCQFSWDLVLLISTINGKYSVVMSQATSKHNAVFTNHEHCFLNSICLLSLESLGFTFSLFSPQAQSSENYYKGWAAFVCVQLCGLNGSNLQHKNVRLAIKTVDWHRCFTARGYWYIPLWAQFKPLHQPEGWATERLREKLWTRHPWIFSRAGWIIKWDGYFVRGDPALNGGLD